MTIRPALTLYFSPGSSSMAAHIALHEVGAAFEPRPLSSKTGGTRTPEYLAINPEGKVPTLLIDGRPLTEVAGILFYLARAYPEAGLLPSDPEGQARGVSWMSFIASSLHPARGKGSEHARAIYGIADARLAGKTWALGDYSIVDIHLFRLFWRFGPLIGLEPGECPNLEAHKARMLGRPAVIRTIEIETALGYELK